MQELPQFEVGLQEKKVLNHIFKGFQVPIESEFCYVYCTCYTWEKGEYLGGIVQAGAKIFHLNGRKAYKIRCKI